jgi:putative molybdopterin biosynthesis protein
VAVTWPQIDPSTGDAWSPRDGAIGANPAAEAFGEWMRTCVEAGWVAAIGAELVSVTAACGRVTADPVRALWSVPAYPAAAMDGIAVRAAGTSTATSQRPMRLAPGEYDLIDTGQQMPDGRDAVIMREHVRYLDDGWVEIDNFVAPGRHVRPIGEDIQAGKFLLPAGHRIRPVDAAALAGAGHHSIQVRRRPVVAILPTGNEVRPMGTILAPGEVLDTNSLMLAGMAEEAGGAAVTLPIIPDQPDEIATAVAQAASGADVVLVIAGSSAGRGDHTAAVVRRLGLIAVHGVAIRPGHPVLLGVLSGERPVPVVGVPGYPASAERAFTCFVLPLLRRVLGMAERTGGYPVAARLACAVSSPGHLEEYLRLRLARVLDPRTGRNALVASPLRRGAGALSSMAQTEALLRIPIGTTGFAAGAQVRPVPVAGAACDAATTIVSGLRSPAMDALIEQCRHELPHRLVQWIECSAREASEALATGLCHAAALALDDAGSATASHSVGADPIGSDPLTAIAARVGELVVLDIARAGTTKEVLVVPARAGDNPAIAVLRTLI